METSGKSKVTSTLAGVVTERGIVGVGVMSGKE